MSYTVKKHDLGYYFISPVPSEQELKDYYVKKYYQDLTVSSYQESYSKNELAVLKIDAELSNDLFGSRFKKGNKRTS